MKKTFFGLTLLMSSLLGLSQIPDNYPNNQHKLIVADIPIKVQPIITLKDSISGNIFVLDSFHINIYALNLKGDTLWKTDPWKDNGIQEYRVKRPVINYFKLGYTRWTDYKEAILICYNNSQFGSVDKTTGKFFLEGQD